MLPSRRSVDGVMRTASCTLDNDLTEAPSTTVEEIAISIGTADEMPDRRDDRSSIVGLEPTFQCPRESLGQWPEVAAPGPMPNLPSCQIVSPTTPVMRESWRSIVADLNPP